MERNGKMKIWMGLMLAGGLALPVMGRSAVGPGIGTEPPVRGELPEGEPECPVQPDNGPPVDVDAVVRRAVDWLVAHQLENGAWGQGEESSNMGRGNDLRDIPNVADTCMAVMALMQSGQTPRDGEHAAAVRRAIEYVCAQVEKHADDDSLYVTDTRGTRVQGKIGTYIDTFLAAGLLAEVKDRMPNDAGNRRVGAALEVVLGKIQQHQQEDGSWAGEGWAPVLSQAMASRGLNRAVARGAAVPPETLARLEQQAQGSFDRESGEFAAGGSAGVDLYGASSGARGMSDAAANLAERQRNLEEELERADSDEERERIRTEIDNVGERADRTRRQLAQARDALVERVGDARFVQGFGNNGGEEYLSYLNISEALCREGGEAWDRWKEAAYRNVGRVQNSDGSWSGHHCITGRTFCTAAALMVLTVEHSPAVTTSIDEAAPVR